MASHTFHQLYYHFAWSTKNRATLISEEVLADFLRSVEEQARLRGGIVLACNAMPDHIHLFVNLPPTLTVATYIGQVKGAVAFYWNKQFPDRKPLE
jgi:putative transposase